MFHAFTLPEVSPGLLIAAGSLLVTVVFLLTFPLRGGHGQHAGSGPGTLTVWALRESLAKPPAQPSEIAAFLLEAMRAERRPGTARERAKLEPPPYVGVHRKAVEHVIDVVHPRVPVFLAPGALRPH
ncbi:hypothetical protein EIL87_22315 [Saccharopolyspora rhizosphaerae]|uniref:Uncharacterized protein n=1 Tax=Saccharopolyspora rhizosphaerae TaxID=2492662 RepID=A0A3R8Q5P1_9PSEU|nr:hypothetical protein [Saccharopolyspora rhizosphaerae]RRO13723.1 hypothetical protein EIL87_22315 [Saccharopolyspora rhizosphaerae]